MLVPLGRQHHWHSDSPFPSLSIRARRDGNKNSSLPGAYAHYTEVGPIAREVLEHNGR